jgi:hypothetical protein
LDEEINFKVIRPRILPAMNLVGGELAIIPLDGLQPQYLDQYSMVYRVPRIKTQNRTIFSVHSVSYLPYVNGLGGSTLGFGGVAPSSMSEIPNTAMRIMDSHSGVPPMSNARVELIADNTLLIHDQFRTTQVYFLRCILANDDNLSNISPRSYLNLAKLIEFGVKSYIYNTLIIKLDRGYLEGGQELGGIKVYVESLSDMEQLYQDWLQGEWRRTAFMNDTDSYVRFIRAQLSAGI